MDYLGSVYCPNLKRSVQNINQQRLIWNRAVESERREKSKNRKKSDKIGKIGSDFLSDFLAKCQNAKKNAIKCHEMP